MLIFFFQAEDGIRYLTVTGVQTCALPISGLMILLGVGRSDSSAVVGRMAERCANLRIFEDDQGKMNRSLLDVKGSALAVSQFTLYGDARGQRRPSFITAAPPELRSEEHTSE